MEGELLIAAGKALSIDALIDEMARYIDSGGFVMPPLVVGTLIMWFGIGWRWMTLQRGGDLPLETWVRKVVRGEEAPDAGLLGRAVHKGVFLAQSDVEKLRPYLGDAYDGIRNEMREFSTIVTAIVAVAPLTGLLGTVTGMIETFASLGDMALFSQSGGIAGGISAALISTQMGLAVAIPGMMVGRMLDRRQDRLEAELQELEELLCANRYNIKLAQTSSDDDVAADQEEA
jgi:biopolymer transport protein ExbB